MAKIPVYLNRYFQKNSYILIYPVQTGIPEDTYEDPNLQPLKKPIINIENVKNMLAKVKLGGRR